MFPFPKPQRASVFVVRWQPNCHRQHQRSWGHLFLVCCLSKSETGEAGAWRPQIPESRAWSCCGESKVKAPVSPICLFSRWAGKERQRSHLGWEDRDPPFTQFPLIKDAHQKQMDLIWTAVNPGSLGELMIRSNGWDRLLQSAQHPVSLPTEPGGGSLAFCRSSNWNVTEQGWPVNSLRGEKSWAKWP